MTSPRWWSLGTKVSALLLLASVLPLLLLSALLLNRERATARAANVALLEARVDEVGHTLEAMYRAYQAASVRAARDPDVVRFCAGPVEGRARLMPVLRQHLEVFVGDDAAIRGAGVVDRSGTVLAATEPQLVGVGISYREHFQRALNGDDTVSEVYVSMTDRTPSVAFSSPVRWQGEVVGVYVLWLRADALWAVMRAANGTAGRGSFFALFDRHGLRVAHSANEDVLFHPSAPVPERVARAMIADRRFQERTAELLSAVIPFPLHEIQGRERRIFRRPKSPTNQVDNLAVARHFPVLAGTLVAHIPESEVEPPVTSLLSRVLPASLLGLVLVFVGGALLMRHVVGPIREIAATAAALERGELTLEEGAQVALHPGQQDEVGGLARAFGSMASSLADRDRSLRERNSELERDRRALVTLSQCNEALVRAADERTLLARVCGTIADVGGYRMCWVGFAENDELKTVRPAAHAGHEEGYLSTVDIVWADTERGRGPVGTAARTGRPVIARSVVTDPNFGPWVGEATKRGYRSVAAIPLRVEGAAAVLGVLAIYAEDVDAFDNNELRLLRELADNLAYGITALRGGAERLRMAAQLQQADRMVAVGTLAAGVAHEINNPLAYVVAAHSFLGEELAALARELPAGRVDETRQALADAREGASRVTTIVRDLKTFSRADEERSGPVDLHRVIDSSINMAANELKHRARLVKDYGPIPLVLGNEARLGQVFLNLLINAAQAIAEGRTDRNEIRVSTRADDSGRAIVEVRDTGIGIAPDVSRHMFDPFFTTKAVGVGTGLGLFICRNIVHAAGGDIAIESQPGEGTVVRVALPPAPAAAEEAQVPAPTPTDELADRRGRVLVVDDEPAIGSAIRRMLRAEHDVVPLTSAREARDRIANGERFDVILCDVMMPLMTGIELHAELTSLAPDQARRIIVLTGGAFTANAQQFLEQCPNPRLEKPLDPTRLRTLVRGLVSTPGTSAA